MRPFLKKREIRPRSYATRYKESIKTLKSLLVVWLRNKKILINAKDFGFSYGCRGEFMARWAMIKAIENHSQGIPENVPIHTFEFCRTIIAS